MTDEELQIYKKNLQKQRAKEYYERNRERIREHEKKYRDLHRAEINARVREKSKNKPFIYTEQKRKYNKEYWEKHKEEIREKSRKAYREKCKLKKPQVYYKECRDEISKKRREYYLQNRDKILAKCREYRMKVIHLQTDSSHQNSPRSSQDSQDDHRRSA